MRLFDLSTPNRLGLIALAGTLSACAATGSPGERPAGTIRISSEPAGAVAYADGVELGATPLEIVPGSHFRAGFVGLSYRYHGTLSVKKPGCETWSVEVNDYLLSKDVHARLKCDPDFRPSAPPAPFPASPVQSSPPQPSRGEPDQDPYVERLERIETLHRKGLISDEEYGQLRARILDNL